MLVSRRVLTYSRYLASRAWLLGAAGREVELGFEDPGICSEMGPASARPPLGGAICGVAFGESWKSVRGVLIVFIVSLVTVMLV
jgi:hypothetical protein